MNSTTPNSLFATDVVISMENTTLGKLILAGAIICIIAALTHKAFN